MDGSNHDKPKTPKKSNHHRRTDAENEELVISCPTLLSTTSTRLTQTGTPRTLSFSDGSSHRGTATAPTPREISHGYSKSSSGQETPTTPSSPDEPPVSLSRIMSRRTPIIFSQTTARRKAQPIEKKLECTLEELCLGCVKKVKITRDVISNEGYVPLRVDVYMLESLDVVLSAYSNKTNFSST